MKRFHWAAAGVLVALTALPVVASATEDGPADSLRTRRTDLLRRSRPELTAPATVNDQPTVGSGDRRTDDQALPGRFDATPTLPDFDETVDAVRTDASLEPGALIDLADFHVLDMGIVAPVLSPELQAVIRRELASIRTLDLPVER